MSEPKATKIFRTVSLERLSSPEQLDQLVRITTPRGWLSLFAILGVIAGAIAWGYLGKVPTKVRGSGILIKTGGLFQIESSVGGQISEIYVAVGDTIKKGQIVGRIAQPELLERVHQAQARLLELERNHQLLKEQGERSMVVRRASIAQRRAKIDSSVEVAQRQLSWYHDKLKRQQQLVKQGMLTEEQLLEIRKEIDATEERIKLEANKSKELEVEELQLANEEAQRLLDSQVRINEQRRALKSLLDNLELSSRIKSAYSGRVIEVLADAGQQVVAGTLLLKLEAIGDRISDLEAVLYVPASDGKRIQSRMTVQLSPSTVQQEEYGIMIGIVNKVSDYPATVQGMKRLLGNDQLVGELSQGGAPIEVYVHLVPDAKTVSGYKWSSPDGPPTRIYSGTLCQATITLHEQTPLELVIPRIKELLGLE